STGVRVPSLKCSNRMIGWRSIVPWCSTPWSLGVAAPSIASVLPARVVVRPAPIAWGLCQEHDTGGRAAMLRFRSKEDLARRQDMDFRLTDEQQAFADAAREFAVGELAPNAARWDAESLFPKETFRRAGDLGFCSMVATDTLGGLG